MSPTKLFLIIFAAILSAAAVIWGIASYNASQKENDAHAASIVEGIATSTNVARLSLEMARLDGVIEDVQLSNFTSTVSGVERMWMSYPKQRLRIRELARDFLSQHREVTKFVRERFPAKKDWADQMDHLLSKLATLVGST